MVKGVVVRLNIKKEKYNICVRANNVCQVTYEINVDPRSRPMHFVSNEEFCSPLQLLFVGIHCLYHCRCKNITTYHSGR